MQSAAYVDVAVVDDRRREVACKALVARSEVVVVGGYLCVITRACYGVGQFARRLAHDFIAQVIQALDLS